jgi:chorismate synthase
MGVTINGIAPGLEIDLEYIREQLVKRSSTMEITTPRKETDDFEIVSGYFNNKTTGAPLTFLIKNNDVSSKDYDEGTLRPSHADFVAKEKYKGFNDYRGGGIFSGRLTVLSTLAGALARSILKSKGIEVYSHIYRVGEIKDTSYLIQAPLKDGALNTQAYEKMISLVEKAKENHDSIGGVIETGIFGVGVGVGNPLFGSMESKIADAIFSIPGIKGIEFGAGFNFGKMTGSQASDSIYFDHGFKTKTNNSGGINGGISNGMPIVFRSVFRPTPSISRKQIIVNYMTKENSELVGKGRHDAGIFIRGMHVISNLAAFALLDLIIESEGRSWMI